MAVFPRELSSGQSFCMVDELVRSWPLRAKFEDDLTILEIVPRNSPPVMNFLVNDVDSYASEHKMVLNSSKCKCIVLDFLDSTWSPIFTGNMQYALGPRLAEEVWHQRSRYHLDSSFFHSSLFIARL